MPGYSSRPPLTQTFGHLRKRPTSGRCRGCGRDKDHTALPGLCRACLDQRDRDKQAAAEDI